MSEPSPSPAGQKLRARDRDAILQTLRAGVVPRRGHQHIQVGRADELAALLQDLERVADGGSAIRFIVGEYGSGKTFFLQLVRSIGLEKGFVAASADLSPSRRLHATGGEARNLYADLMANLATRTRPEGGALPSVVERFVTSALQESRERGVSTRTVIDERLAALAELPGGYDFAEVVAAYWKGHDEDGDRLKSDAVRWLRGEFTTRTDARNALGVRTIVDDASIYDHLKLFARFVRLAGYSGLIACFDEMVNLYKLANSRARNSNYELVLRIVNDSLQGAAVGLGVLFGGTPGADDGPAPRSLQLRGAALAAGSEPFRGGRVQRPQRAGGGAAGAHPGRALRSPAQPPPRPRFGRSGGLPPARPGAGGLHGALPAADRRGLLPHPAQHHPRFPRAAGGDRAES